jgi:hypothetical protein
MFSHTYLLSHLLIPFWLKFNHWLVVLHEEFHGKKYNLYLNKFIDYFSPLTCVQIFSKLSSNLTSCGCENNDTGCISHILDRRYIMVSLHPHGFVIKLMRHTQLFLPIPRIMAI